MIGVLGGSFDPVHNGHLQAARVAKETLNLTEVRFIPCFAHAFEKSFIATTAQRIALLEIALKPYPDFKLDLREIEAEKTSYMIDTLLALNKEFSTESLGLILGTDVFKHIQQWHRWQEITEYANIVVLNRPGEVASEQTVDHFLNKAQDSLIFIEDDFLELSSTSVRKQLQNKQSIKTELPPDCISFIDKEKIYQ